MKTYFVILISVLVICTSCSTPERVIPNPVSNVKTYDIEYVLTMRPDGVALVTYHESGNRREVVYDRILSDTTFVVTMQSGDKPYFELNTACISNAAIFINGSKAVETGKFCDSYETSIEYATLD